MVYVLCTSQHILPSIIYFHNLFLILLKMFNYILLQFQVLFMIIKCKVCICHGNNPLNMPIHIMWDHMLHVSAIGVVVKKTLISCCRGLA